MADDYSINAKITADPSGYTSGVQSAIKSSKKLSSTLATVGLALNGLTASFKLISGAIGKVTKTVGDCTEAYKVQLNAERALDNAVKNSPIMSGESAENLKKFAGEIQKVTNYGDEQVLPLITQLTVLGRTEAEAMKIIKVATDMASTGTVSMETAVNQLNMTLNGTIGRLGIQNAELKDLTKEELANGRAVEILGEKYKGMAQAVLDPSKQLNNLMGDLKETIGEKLYPTIQAFTIDSVKSVQKIIEKVKELNVDKIGAVVRVLFNDLKSLLSEIASRIAKVSESAKTIFTKVVSSDEFKKVVEFVNALVNAIAFLYNEISRVFNEIRQKIREIVVNIFEITTTALMDSETSIQSWSDFFWNHLNNVFRTIQDVINSVSAIIHGDWEVAWEYAKLSVARVADAILDLLSTIVNAFPKMVSKITDFLNELIKKVNTVREFFGQDPIGLLEPLKNVDFSKSSGLEQFITDTENRIAELTGHVADKGVEDIERFSDGAKINLANFIDNFKAKVADAENENKMIVAQYGADVADTVEEMGEAIEDAEDSTFKRILKKVSGYISKTIQIIGKVLTTVKDIGKKAIEVVKNVASNIKNVISKAVDIFGNLFEFNIDDALDKILQWEDNILTFFVETLPKLPNFVKSVVQSVKSLLASVKSVLQTTDLKGIILDILDTLSSNLPQIVSEMMDILVIIVNDAIDGLIQWLGEGQGLETLLNVILTIQQGIEKIVTENLDKIVDFLAENVDKIADFLAQSMASANRTLPKIIKAVLNLIVILIEAIAKAFENEDFIDSIVEAVEGLIDAISEITPKLVSAVVKLIINVITALIPRLPEIILYLVNAIVQSIPQILGQLVSAFGEIFSKIFSGDFWWKALSNLGDVLWDIIKSALTGHSDGGTTTGSTAGDIGLGILTGGISTIGSWFGWWAKGTNDVPRGLSIVGEAGPELINFRGGEQILNNRNTNKALAELGSGKSITNNITFNNLQDTTAYAMMNQLKQYNRQMAINGVI